MKPDDIYPGGLKSNVKQKSLEVSWWEKQAFSLILSFWEHEPPSKAKRSNTEFIVLSTLVMADSRDTFCAQITFWNLININLFSAMLCFSLVFDNLCTLETHFVMVFDKMVIKHRFLLYWFNYESNHIAKATKSKGGDTSGGVRGWGL